jgi:hypothetical protein
MGKEERSADERRTHTFGTQSLSFSLCWVPNHEEVMHLSTHTRLLFVG